MREFYAALYGEEVSRDAIADQGWECLQDEWEFNKRAGFSAADDKLAECCEQDAIGPAKVVFDVPADIIQQVYTRLPAGDDLYTMKASG
jgi:aldehyde:ferredoxin oxidoreductase